MGGFIIYVGFRVIKLFNDVSVQLHENIADVLKRGSESTISTYNHPTNARFHTKWPPNWPTQSRLK